MSVSARGPVAVAVEVLNRLHAADRTVLPALIGLRVPCNRAVADDPTVQVRVVDEEEGRFEVGLLGVVNGLFGVRGDQAGLIAAVFDDDGSLSHFEVNVAGGDEEAGVDGRAGLALWEEGTVFRAALGASSVVGGMVVRAKDVVLLVGDERVPRVVEVGVRDVAGDASCPHCDRGLVAERVGSVRFRSGHAPDEMAGDVEVQVSHPEDGRMVRSFRAWSCVWTRHSDDLNIWCFRGSPT